MHKFINFLEKNVSKHGCLFILGDLFDWWIGDDSNQFSEIIAALKKLSKSMNIYFIAGNRDFFIGNEFEKKTGLKIEKLAYYDSMGFLFLVLNKLFSLKQTNLKNKIYFWNLLMPISKLIDTLTFNKFGKSLLCVFKKC